MDNIQKYLCDWELSEDFVEQIDSFAVWRANVTDFGNAFFIMKNQDVYAAGDIIQSCVNGLSSVDSNSKKNPNDPILISELCCKRFKKFVFGGSQVLVCTEEGEVFGYGFYYTRVGAAPQFLSPQKISSLEGLRVVDVAIGPQGNCLALRDDGKIEVFEFSILSKDLVNTIPDLPVADAKSLNIINVARHCYISLLENGKVMKIDINVNDFLSCNAEKKLKRNTWEVMSFPAADPGKIEKIIPGYSSALALDEYGRLFVMSYDSTLRGEFKIHESECNSVSAEKIVDIAASRFWNLSAALTESGKVYMWGKGRGATILKPKLTSFKSLHEVFLHYSMLLVTYKLTNVHELRPEPMKKPSLADPEINLPECRTTNMENFLADTFKNAFHNSTYCDFFVEVEGKMIPVHKSVLALRCKHFAEIFQKNMPDEKPSILEIEDGDFKVYRAFLEYLYTDQIDNSLSFYDIIELLNLANKYHLEVLAERCVLLIQSDVTVENVIYLHGRATALSKVTKIKYIFDKLLESCVRFVADNETEVVISPEFAKLDSNVAKELIVSVCQRRFKK